MINYKDSDYALNKHSEGIVYKYADGSKYTIMLEDYLAANTNNTVEGFAKLEAWSDNEYHEQVIVDHRTGRLDVLSTIGRKRSSFLQLPLMWS